MTNPDKLVGYGMCFISNDVILVLGGALFGALYAAMIFFSL